jgi:hypothetical protein
VKTPEGYEKDDICKYLDTIGCWYFKSYMAGFGKSGVPDIVACINGSFISIEVKREGKLPTPIQARRMMEISTAGGCVFWGTSEKVIREIKTWYKPRYNLAEQVRVLGADSLLPK